MPASYLMSWEPKSRRWWKQYKGKRYVVSCRQLGTPETKEASYQLANAWWIARKAALDGETDLQDGRHIHRTVIDDLAFRRDWCKANGRPDEAALWARRIDEVRAMPVESNPYTALVSPVVAGRLDYLQRAGGSIPAEMAPEDLEFQVGDGELWYQRERQAQIVSAEKSISGLSQRFLKLIEARVTSKELSASEYDLACRCVGHAVDFFGGSNEPSVIDADRWEAYWLHLRQLITDKKRSREYAKKDWRYARAFVEWMSSVDKMDPPKNLHNRRYKFGETRQAVETFDVEEVRKMVKGATGQLKLHLLLMLNCGFYQSDISDLRHDEVDLEKGYITRQRSKTRQHHGDKVPTVAYKLWPLTLELLRSHLSGHPKLALTTLAGKPWVEEKVEGNRVKSRRDGIKSNFAHLAKKLKITKPLKSFRKTSATLLDAKPEYARFAPFFLGHAGKTVAEEHYIRRGGQPFDEAVEWLGKQYGF